ncbi:MAG: aminodeoxychorismate synthase component I [Candidatus Hydrogenedentes bacterium]|nr:aminodeoxychorismate synthase component I [Candidatus Hydrogenedentota bacterium]
MSTPTPIGHIEFSDGDMRRVYTDPVERIETNDVREVQNALAHVEARVAEGYHAAGYVAYEAASAFDPAFQTHELSVLPLLSFGIYKEAYSKPSPARSAHPLTDTPAWKPALKRVAYDAAIAQIKKHIAAGDTYQVNYTFPTTADFHLDGLTWFHERQQAPNAAYSAYLNLGHHEIISLSPELFFSLDGTALTSRPMKGTRPRGLSAAQDEALAKELRHSPKEQAENLMIVDMLRNDMGRVCDTGSIRVPSLFSIEQYPTVWQMTSTVTGTTHASIPAIFQALFPCASVTGAPKIETMKIIRQLESSPRGVYCGAIGWWSPERQAQFNVAIRTAVVNTASRSACYSVGSGITWDSVDALEYQECETKATVLQHTRPDFELLTSLRLDSEGYFLRSHHLDRLERSAAYFAFPFDRKTITETLDAYGTTVTTLPAKVRLCMDDKGHVSISHAEVSEPTPWKVGLAQGPIDTAQPWVYHKTTHRDCYDIARATRPDCTDVILATADGYLTETTYANIVLQIGDKKYTPSLEDGLLDGVFRRQLLEEGTLEERSLTVEDLARADRIYLINSVRKWIEVNWQDG